MSVTPISTPFSRLLDGHRGAAGLSQNALAHRAGIDPAFVNRMVRWGAIPSRPVALALAGALGLDDHETDRLLYAAGHAPVHDWQTLALDYARRLEQIDRALVGLELPPASQPENALEAIHG